jgi:hypothetical protein
VLDKEKKSIDVRRNLYNFAPFKYIANTCIAQLIGIQSAFARINWMDGSICPKVQCLISEAPNIKNRHIERIENLITFLSEIYKVLMAFDSLLWAMRYAVLAQIGCTAALTKINGMDPILRTTLYSAISTGPKKCAISRASI